VLYEPYTFICRQLGYAQTWVHSHAPSIRSHRGTQVVWPDFQPMRVPEEEPVRSDLFRQNPVFTFLHLKSPVHVVPPLQTITLKTSWVFRSRGANKCFKNELPPVQLIYPWILICYSFFSGWRGEGGEGGRCSCKGWLEVRTLLSHSLIYLDKCRTYDPHICGRSTVLCTRNLRRLKIKM
jgi:hypothetical protein